jgi:hypothetical protein
MYKAGVSTTTSYTETLFYNCVGALLQPMVREEGIGMRKYDGEIAILKNVQYSFNPYYQISASFILKMIVGFIIMHDNLLLGMA